VTSAIEHKAVLDTCAYLETKGYEVTYLEPDRPESSIRNRSPKRCDPTLLVSLMHVTTKSA
jgi:cysteine desulfurase